MGSGRRTSAWTLALVVVALALLVPTGVAAQEQTGADEAVDVGAVEVGSEVVGAGGAVGADENEGAACSGGGRTLSGTLQSTNGRAVHALVGLAIQDANGVGIAGPNPGYFATQHLNHSTPVDGTPGGPTPFSFSGIPDGACTYWLEIYPLGEDDKTDRTYFSGGLARSRPLSAGATNAGAMRLAATCGVGGGTAGGPSGWTTGDTIVHAYVNSTPRGINRLSYWSNTQNPNNLAYGFGVEAPAAPYPSVLRVPAMASDQRYDVRVQIPSTGGDLASIIPNVPVYQCEDTHLHAVWTPFGVASTIGRFRDTPETNPFHDDIEWMADNEITTGYADGTYRPVSIVSRQAMSAFMYRLAGEPDFELPETPSFSDVGPSNDFYDEIEWMAVEGISTGYEDGTYRPSGQVTRGAMSAFMYRLAGEPEFTPPETPSFSDVATDFAFFLEIEWMNDEEITTGYAGGVYKPGAGVTRQAMSAFMHRLAPLLQN
jgi:hypothetical protein